MSLVCSLVIRELLTEKLSSLAWQGQRVKSEASRGGLVGGQLSRKVGGEVEMEAENLRMVLWLDLSGLSSSVVFSML